MLHQLKNALAAADGYVDMMQEATHPGDPPVRGLRQSLDRAKVVMAALESYRVLLRLEVNQPQPVSLDRIVARQLKELDEQSQDSNLSIEYKRIYHLPLVQTHPQFVIEILQLLISFFASLSAEPIAVIITAEAKGELVYLRFTSKQLKLQAADFNSLQSSAILRRNLSNTQTDQALLFLVRLLVLKVGGRMSLRRGTITVGFVRARQLVLKIEKAKNHSLPEIEQSK